MARVTCIICRYQGQPSPDQDEELGLRKRIAFGKPRCFRCGGSLPAITDARARFHKGRAVGRIKCRGCGHVSDYPLRIVGRPVSEGVDPVFGLELFLSVPIGRWTLWASNVEHIDMLETWLSASLRERSLTPYYMTMMARLPQWMKRASHRPAVLKGLARLRAKASQAGVS